MKIIKNNNKQQQSYKTHENMTIYEHTTKKANAINNHGNCENNYNKHYTSFKNIKN